MTLNPSLTLYRPLNPRGLALIVVLALAAAVGGGPLSAAKAVSPAHALVCKCANCPGEGKCCCSAGFCDTPGGVK